MAKLVRTISDAIERIDVKAGDILPQAGGMSWYTVTEDMINTDKSLKQPIATTVHKTIETNYAVNKIN